MSIIIATMCILQYKVTLLELLYCYNMGTLPVPETFASALSHLCRRNLLIYYKTKLLFFFAAIFCIIFSREKYVHLF